jgi:hypothetical protein
MAIVKAGIPIPRNPGCPNTDDKSFLQNVKVNLSILNTLSPRVNSRRPSDYYNRSTSPWNLQYVRTPDKMSVLQLSYASDCQLSQPDHSFNHSESSAKPGMAIVLSSESQIFILQSSLTGHSTPHPITDNKMST